MSPRDAGTAGSDIQALQDENAGLRRATELLRVRAALLEYAAEHSLEPLLVKTLDEIGALTDSPIGFYHFVEPDQKTLSLQAWSTRTVKEFCSAEGKGRHYAIDEAGVWVDCVRQRRPVIHNDYSSLPHRKGLPAGHAVVTRELVVPIMRSDLIVAILGVGNKPSEYTEKDVETVAYVADVAWEIVQRKRAEEALQEANRQLQEADRQKNEFLAVLSHELRNPLAPIMNSLYVLKHAAPEGDQAQRAQEVINRQVGQLTRLVDDLLDVTRISLNKVQLRRQVLELNDLVRHALDDHRSQFDNAGVHLEFAPGSSPVLVSADPNRLAQAVGNLLHNAAKFTGRGGRATVSVSTDPDAGQAAVCVSDTGVGMTQDDLSQLFRPFMQANKALDRGRGGLGLGLSLVKGLVELHGGTIEAHSGGLGQGSEFILRLPLELSRAVADKSSSVGMPGRRRVLIIEDNVDAADSLRDALQLGEHDVTVAYNGPDGLAKGRELRPDIVLCDIGLPGMDGYEVARAFRADETLNGIVLVALTGYALPEDLRRAQAAGFNRHLAKPPTFEKLQELLASVPVPDRDEL